MNTYNRCRPARQSIEECGVGLRCSSTSWAQDWRTLEEAGEIWLVVRNLTEPFKALENE
jgi:hypothetical protein